MIPKYSNPSVLLDSTAIVSRSALNGDSDDEVEDTYAHDTEHAQMVARLENVLKRSIADVLPQAPNGESDEGSREKKKRKVEKESTENGLQESNGAGAQEVVCTFYSSLLLLAHCANVVYLAFRLFSGTSQPKPIVLAPKPPPVLMCVLLALDVRC